MVIKAKTDFYVGITLLIISVVIFILTLDIIAEAATFPRSLSILLGAFSIIILLSSIKKTDIDKDKDEEDKNNSGDETKFTLKTFLGAMISAILITLYIIVINYIGYIYSTILYLIVFFFFMRVKGILKYILVPIGFTLFVYLLFVIGLNLMVPSGSLFN